GRAAAAELLENQPLLGLRDAGAAVPHLDAPVPVDATAAQQRAAMLGVAQGVGEEVLQHPAQQLRVRMRPAARTDHAQADAAFLGERTELGGQRIEYLGQREVARADVEATALQLRDVEQASQQVFGGGQRTVQVLRGRDRLVAREAHLQRMREQLRG